MEWGSVFGELLLPLSFLSLDMKAQATANVAPAMSAVCQDGCFLLLLYSHDCASVVVHLCAPLRVFQ
jgi:hypothetical protein